MVPPGPPYIPQIWALGGLPKKNVDVPITAVFLCLFVGGAVMHMTIFQLNNRRSHKFLISVFLFGFCMARITTCAMRIASVCIPTNIRLAIAAQIFVAAGVLIVFIVNLLFAQRICRSLHPSVFWHPVFSIAFKALYALIVLTLVMIITVTVQSFYTLRPRTRTIDRDIQLYAGTFFAIISFLPIPLVLIALAVPRKQPIEKFGQGRHRVRVAILLIGSTLVCLGAAFRSGINWKHPVPRSHPMPSYYSKACFYIFNFTLEILVVYLYGIMRIDRRFHIPNGAHGPGSYAAGSSKQIGMEDVNGEAQDGDKKAAEAYTPAVEP